MDPYAQVKLGHGVPSSYACCLLSVWGAILSVSMMLLQMGSGGFQMQEGRIWLRGLLCIPASRNFPAGKHCALPFRRVGMEGVQVPFFTHTVEFR